jgi:hypothetical protein
MTVSAPGHRNWEYGMLFLSDSEKIRILSKENNALPSLQLLGAGRVSLASLQPRMKWHFFIRCMGAQANRQAQRVAEYTLG